MKKTVCLLLALLVAAPAWADPFSWDSGYQGSSPSASDIKTDTTNFNTNLSSADDTVQDALETLDELVAGGGGTPGGSNTQVQYNNAGSFGGDAGLTYVATTDTLTTGTVINHILQADGSDGIRLDANNGTDIGILGIANTANATWYGAHQFPSVDINGGTIDGTQIGSSSATDATFTDLTLNTMTTSSVMFTGTNGKLTQDNQNFYWDDINNRLGITSTIGSEKVTNGSFTGSASSWTLASGWAYSSNSVSHNSDGTGTLAQNISAVAGEYYLLTYTISGWTVGSVTPAIGGTSGTAVSANGTYSERILSGSSTATVVFTPTNTARFTIDNVSVKRLTGGSIFTGSANLMINDNASTPNTSSSPAIDINNSASYTYLKFRHNGTLNGAITSVSGGNMQFWNNNSGFNFYNSVSSTSAQTQINSSGIATIGGAFSGSVSAGSQSFGPASTLTTAGSFGRTMTYMNFSQNITSGHAHIVADASTSNSCTGTPSAACSSWLNQSDCEKWDAHGGCTWNAGTSCSIYNNQSGMTSCAGQAGCTVVTTSCNGPTDQSSCEAQDDSYGGACTYDQNNTNCVWMDPDCSGDVACDAGDSTDQATCEAITYPNGTYTCNGTYNTGSCTGTFGAACSGTSTCSGIDDSTNCGNETGCTWSTSMTLTLPAIGSSNFFRQYTVTKYSGTGTLLLASSGGATIDGAASPYSYGTTNKKSRTFEAVYVNRACTDFSTQTPCNAQTGCSWVDCTTYPDQSSCEGAGCSWSGSCSGSYCSGSYDKIKDWSIVDAYL